MNPKYADEAKIVFKKPTRLECMMQEYPKLLANDPSAKVGFTQMERFLSFSAVKNNAVDAVAKLEKTGFPESASSGEAAIYDTNRRLMAMAGCQASVPHLTPGLERAGDTAKRDARTRGLCASPEEGESDLEEAVTQGTRN